MYTIEQIKRIKQLKEIQQIEEENNFLNGDLWNDCQDKIENFARYNQEEDPKPMTNTEGLQIGIILKNGDQIHYSGMTHENSAN